MWLGGKKRIELTGEVVDALGSGKRRVVLDKGAHEAACLYRRGDAEVPGPDRVGDEVKVELSRYDLNQGPDRLSKPGRTTTTSPPMSGRPGHPGRSALRVTRWQRVGTATLFVPEAPGENGGWEWRIRREGNDERTVRVEVGSGFSRATDLSADSRQAIRTRGATAVDAFLHLDDPPARIVISSVLLQPEQ